MTRTRRTPGHRPRSRRAAALSAVTAAVALTATTALLPTSAAFAAGSDDILSYGAPDPNGTNVSNTDSVDGSLESGTTATFKFTANGNPVVITCTEVTIVIKVTSNPPPPGTATFVIEELIFGGCTVTGESGVSVAGITLKSGTTATGTITDSTPPTIDITNINEAVTLKTALGNVICDYGTTSAVTAIRGTLTNPSPAGADGSVVFSDDPIGLISGSSYCGAAGSTGSFSMTLDGLFVSAEPVYVN
jgi:hypothetical protein